jgi:site-specific DNA recombinase
MMRAAIYARFSSDNQSVSSITDQVEVCSRYIAKNGWTAVTTYSDAAMSGASRFRPDYQRLLADLDRGHFDVVVVEALDRLGRKLADVADLHDRCTFAGIKLIAVNVGEIGAMHIGMLGTMAQLYLSDLREKTWRGQLGRALQGKLPGGNAFGYDLVIEAKGSNGAGERRINEAEAAVVRRIFAEFAASRSPRQIAKRLNVDGVRGPGGRPWSDTTIRGQAERGTGILNNALYVGRLEWNRCGYVKNPQTGKRVARPNPKNRWEITEVLHLRIVADELWQRVKARQAALAFTVRRDAKGVALNRAHRQKYLLSGLLRCGVCDAPYVAQGHGRFACSRHRRGGPCENAGWIDGQAIEARVLVGLKEKLLEPSLVAAFVEEFERELQVAHRQAAGTARELRARLQACERQIANIVNVVTEGRSNPALLKRLDQLEAELASLKGQLGAVPAQATAEIVRLPAGAEIYRRKVETLEIALQDEAIRPEAIEILRSMMERVVVTPTKAGALRVELYGDIARLMTADAPMDTGTAGKKPVRAASSEATRTVLSVVAGIGFEPMTFRL